MRIFQKTEDPLVPKKNNSSKLAWECLIQFVGGLVAFGPVITWAVIACAFLACANPQRLSGNKSQSDTTAPANALNLNRPETEFKHRSDKLAHAYSISLAELDPEMGSALGFAQFNEETIGLDRKWEEKHRLLEQKWIENINQELKIEENREAIIDLKILKAKIQLSLDYEKMTTKLCRLDFEPVSLSVFDSVQTLANPQSILKNKLAAFSRFQKIVKGFNKNGEAFLPRAEAAEDLFEFHQEQCKSKKFIWPSKQKMSEYLKNSGSYLQGTFDLLLDAEKALAENQVPLPATAQGWRLIFDEFKMQVDAYDDFLKEEVLPHTKDGSRLHREFYNLNLREAGVDSTPEVLLKAAKTDYAALKNEYNAKAREVFARLKKRPEPLNQLEPTPNSILNFFKTRSVMDRDAALAMYEASAARLSSLIEQNQIISQPQSKLLIRAGTDAESKAQPVPNLRVGSFVGEHRERPEFIVPLSMDGRLPYDDFSFPEAALILTAHEGRPGHELQFGQMLDRGISLIRATYALNSANVEGWALYAESLIYPYLTPEEQLAALRMRLWRVARMFLDPEVQLGLTNEQKVFEVFANDIGISKELAKEEYNRYAFRSPGQATSYYYGYKHLIETREMVKKRQGVHFNLKCFNDTLVGLGAIPLSLIREELLKNLPTCAGASN